MSYNASAITKIFLSSALYFIWHPWALNLLSMIDTPNCLIVVGFVPRLRLLGQPYKGWENVAFLSVSMSSHLPCAPVIVEMGCDGPGRSQCRVLPGLPHACAPLCMCRPLSQILPCAVFRYGWTYVLKGYLMQEILNFPAAVFMST